MPISYGQEIVWYSWSTQTVVTANGYSTQEEAFLNALRGAIQLGWTPPKLWQWWRWRESYWRWSEAQYKVVEVFMVSDSKVKGR